MYFGIGNDDAAGGNEEEVGTENASRNANRPVTVVTYTDGNAARLTDALMSGVDNRSSASATANNAELTEEVVHRETTSIIDPDLTDYIDGMVNTTRNANGGGRNNNDRNNNSGGGGELGSSLLASYLSSLGLGSNNNNNNNGGIGGGSGIGGGGGNNNARAVRMGGGNNGALGGLAGGGPGIDIHIHAIVTGPGMGGSADVGGGGGFGGEIATNTGNNATTANNRPAAAPSPNATAGSATTTPTRDGIPLVERIRHVPVTYDDVGNDDEDDNLFSDLYSESPNPINLHCEEETRIVGIREENDNDDDGSGDVGVGDLNLLFEECRSIEDDEGGDDESSVNGDSKGCAAEAAGEEMSTDEEAVLRGDNAALAGGAPTSNATPMPSPSSRSSSFGNRLLRRAFGRLSSSSRRSGSRGSGRGA